MHKDVASIYEDQFKTAIMVMTQKFIEGETDCKGKVFRNTWKTIYGTLSGNQQKKLHPCFMKKEVETFNFD